jgi:hypothetical protein
MSLRQYVDIYSNWRVIHYGTSKMDNIDALSPSELLDIYTPGNKKYDFRLLLKNKTRWPLLYMINSSDLKVINK